MTHSPIFIALLPLESIDIREQANRPLRIFTSCFTVLTSIPIYYSHTPHL